MQKKPLKKIDGKLQSLKAHSKNSLDSITGYMDHGNDSVYQAKARVMRHEDNGSHL